MLKICLIGANGRIGLEIANIIAVKNNQYQLQSAVVANLANIKEPLQKLAKHIVIDINQISRPDVVIDFSTPKITLPNTIYCAKNKIPVLIGTTGLSQEEKRQIETYAKDIPILIAANTSLSVNVLFKLAEMASAKLREFETEISEAHHRYKKDAPSGTAIKLGEMIAQGRNIDFATHAKYTRYGKDEARERNDIGFSVVRGGDIVGMHDAMFIGDGEILHLKSNITNRGSFANGALVAGKFLHNKEPGLYTMFDVLGI